MKNIRIVIALVACLLVSIASISQPGAEIEVKQKPDKYESRKLGAEKTGEKKFTLPRRFIQNTVTHYNYYFNANNRLNEIVVRAKSAHKDDFSKLLDFYNYSLDVTAQDSSELDSVIYKCTAGILLHDLRNDWVDNMYMIMGKAYFFRKDWDSAALTFQYINYSYAPKEDGNYDIPIGSNASESGEFSIATRESKNFFKKLFKRAPSRNASFVWQVRNFIDRGALPEAAGLLEILRNDPNFPKRLRPDLNEMLAYLFYQREVYDSSAHFLSKALGEADNNKEKARWEFLIGQMYQKGGNFEKASTYYDRSIKHTNDPIMGVYARLHSIRVNRSGKKDYLQSNINDLVKMAKREKYVNYRDIIYFAAANIELERDGFDNAEKFLLESTKYANNNPMQRTESFMMLAEINYNKKKFPPASNYYDSADINLLALETDKERVTFRKPPLKVIHDDYLIITEQDSLQRLAKMPVDKRDIEVRKIVKLLRKEKGLKEDDSPSFNPAVQQKPSDLFEDNSKGGDFYFYNASLKAKGFSEFKGRWGQRPNTDNWRRKEAIEKQSQMPTDPDSPDNVKPDAASDSIKDFSFEGLLSRLPLDEERMKASNKKIEDALFSTGITLFNKLEEYASAIEVFEDLLKRFPETEHKEEVYFYLVYAYQKTGNISKSDYYKKLLQGASAENKWAKQLNNEPTAENAKTAEGTRKYGDIYNLFIEGKFDLAKAEKKMADSLYGNTFWTPNLMFIEAVYYIKEKDDSTAIKVLTDLSTLHASNPLSEKAKTMVEVLKRRSEIEKYLNDLEVTRVGDDKPVVKADPPKVNPITQQRDTATNKPTTTIIPDKKPTIIPAKPDTMAVNKPVVVSPYKIVATDQHFVAVVMDKVDLVYIGEAKNAFNRYNREKFYNQTINLSSEKIDDRYSLVLQGPFADAAAAVDYVDKVKPVTAGRILPWLTAGKYSFSIISSSNLNLVKANKDLEDYMLMLKQVYPDKF